MAGLVDIECVELPRGFLQKTTENLREFGRAGNEGFLLWLGRLDGTVARVEHVLVPPQNPIKSEDGVGYFITGETLFAVNRYLSANGLRLIAQVHSHPTHAYHSEMDDRYAIVTAEGGLSIVVPWFGEGAPVLELWAVYRLIRGRWTRLEERTVNALFAK